jgi:hypothetical protein
MKTVLERLADKSKREREESSDSSISVPGWPIFWMVVFCAGEPDLLDAIIKFIGGF